MENVSMNVKQIRHLIRYNSCLFESSFVILLGVKRVFTKYILARNLFEYEIVFFKPSFFSSWKVLWIRKNLGIWFV